jgi:SPFH domain / Band 7 family
MANDAAHERCGFRCSNRSPPPILLRFSPIRVIPSGDVGVLTMFGRVTGQVVGEGVNVVNPLATIHAMSIRTQEVKEGASVPSKEGLILRMGTALLFHLDAGHAAQVFRKVGPNYVDVIINPICDPRFVALRRKTPRTRSTPEAASWWLRESRSSDRSSPTVASSSKTCCCATSNCPRPSRWRSKPSKGPSRTRYRWNAC